MLPNRFSGEGNTIPLIMSQGYDPVIVTSSSRDEAFTRRKIEQFFGMATSEMNKEFQCVVICTFSPEFKKPNPYTYEYYKTLNPDVDPKISCFCGDAAGRTYTDISTERTYFIDYSDDDIQYARNIGLKFYTPEDLFTPPRLDFPGKQEIVLMMGMPGSGKSWVSRRMFVGNGYKIVNQDFLHSYDRCLSTTKYYLSQGFSVVVDNTNPMSSTRMGYVGIARYFNIDIRLIYVAQDGQHINQQRPNPVPPAAYGMYFNRLEYPRIEEGYKEILIWWPKLKDSEESSALKQRIEENYLPVTTPDSGPVKPKIVFRLAK